MATIGLYDMDFNHGSGFTLNLSLMKAYARFTEEGHQVIMMDAYEKTGRFNKIFYFKDNPALVIPRKLVIDQDKSVYCGLGYYGNTGLSEKTEAYTPSFTPYDLMKHKIRNKELYGSVKKNSLIDWRTKDFSLTKGDAIYTYVNDRNFLLEDDWRELFQHYDNKISFLHTVSTYSIEQAKEFKELAPNIAKSRILVPLTTDAEALEMFAGNDNYCFDNRGDTDAHICLIILAAKTLTDKKISFFNNGTTKFQKDLCKWARAGQVSFKDFMGNDFNESDYITFPNRLLLKQDPKKISYQELMLNP